MNLAYKVASKHSLDKGPEFAEAEWMSGWIALSFLDDPNTSNRSFPIIFIKMLVIL